VSGVQQASRRPSEHPTAARKRWAKGLAVATDLGFPVERGRTLLEMAHRLGDVAMVDEAIQVFEQTGARVDLAFALHARAELAPTPAARQRLLRPALTLPHPRAIVDGPEARPARGSRR
jgi:hypothetical protein